jgi:hypothetical protein
VFANDLMDAPVVDGFDMCAEEERAPASGSLRLSQPCVLIPDS